MEALASSNRLTQVTLPDMAAACRGVSPEPASLSTNHSWCQPHYRMNAHLTLEMNEQLGVCRTVRRGSSVP